MERVFQRLGGAEIRRFRPRRGHQNNPFWGWVYMIPYMVGKLAPNSTHFNRGLVKEVPGRGYFCSVPSQNGDKFVTSPSPPQSLNDSSSIRLIEVDLRHQTQTLRQPLAAHSHLGGQVVHSGHDGHDAVFRRVSEATDIGVVARSNRRDLLNNDVGLDHELDL